MADQVGVELLVDPSTRTGWRTGPFEGPDGLTLFERSWRPARAPRAVVVLVHGFAEHSGRYAHVAALLNRAGYAVYAYDQRGHGRSEGRRGFVRRFDQYLNDLAAFLDRVRVHSPGLPLFLMGHSMGGTVCARFCIERRPDVTGLVLSSPFLQAAMKIPAPLRRSSDLLAVLFPTFPTLYLNRDDLSRDPVVVAQAKADPLNFTSRIPARTGHEMLQAGERVLSQLERLTVPFLTFHGTCDRIADPHGSLALYARAGAEDKTLSLYEGLYHETFNEPEKEQVLDELAAWLDEHA